jgi:hypothetical protein
MGLYIQSAIKNYRFKDLIPDPFTMLVKLLDFINFDQKTLTDFIISDSNLIDYFIEISDLILSDQVGFRKICQEFSEIDEGCEYSETDYYESAILTLQQFSKELSFAFKTKKSMCFLHITNKFHLLP